VRKRGRERESREEGKKRTARQKGRRMEESQGLSLITGLDLIMVATGAASASAALASAVASNEVAANGPDMDEKLSRLNAPASASARSFFVITRSFKALPGTNARNTRALCFGTLFLPPSFSFFPFLVFLFIRLSDCPNSFHN